jgi:hypothetical protein
VHCPIYTTKIVKLRAIPARASCLGLMEKTNINATCRSAFCFNIMQPVSTETF